MFDPLDAWYATSWLLVVWRSVSQLSSVTALPCPRGLLCVVLKITWRMTTTCTNTADLALCCTGRQGFPGEVLCGKDCRRHDRGRPQVPSVWPRVCKTCYDTW